MSDFDDSDMDSSPKAKRVVSGSQKKAKEHAKQLQRLQEKDPEFYEYLKEHDKELLEFGADDFDEEDAEMHLEDVESDPPMQQENTQPQKVITTDMVDSWCKAAEDGKLSAVRSLLRAFRTACHYGDEGENGAAPKFSIMSSSVFNNIMVFVLSEMDRILRDILNAPSAGGKKETVMELMTSKTWKKYGSLMRLYLGNALHILTQMTDEQMISFTLKRVKASCVFLAAFPTLLRKYIKVALHTWISGRSALSVISLIFLRDLCVRLGLDCLESCLKGVYKAYVLNCKLSKSISRSKLRHIQFLANCVTEIYGVDPQAAYQHAFVFIRQLAIVLRGALTEKGSKAEKDKKKGNKQQDKSKSKSAKQLQKAYQKVYDWQFIFCLELWTGVICTYNSEVDFRPLAYPLTQIIYGVASLVPTSRYFPLRLRCIRMLNRIAEATGTFIPVSSLLLDMLEMKELKNPPTGGVGKAVNLLNVKQVDKATLKTRAFQEACIQYVIEELAKHLALWSYSVAFFELSFIPLVRMRSFCKYTKADRFRREVKELIRQVEKNAEFVNSERLKIDFLPNDPATASFLKAEKESQKSPLSKYVATLHLRAKQRDASLVESSVLVGEESSIFSSKLPEIDGEDDSKDDEEGVAAFSSSWLPQKKTKVSKEKKIKKQHPEKEDADADEDVVEDLVLSSDDDDDDDDDGALYNGTSVEEEDQEMNHSLKGKKSKKRKSVTSDQDSKKQKLDADSSKKKRNYRRKKRAKTDVNS